MQRLIIHLARFYNVDLSRLIVPTSVVDAVEKRFLGAPRGKQNENTDQVSLLKAPVASESRTQAEDASGSGQPGENLAIDTSPGKAVQDATPPVSGNSEKSMQPGTKDIVKSAYELISPGPETDIVILDDTLPAETNSLNRGLESVTVTKGSITGPDSGSEKRGSVSAKRSADIENVPGDGSSQRNSKKMRSEEPPLAKASHHLGILANMFDDDE